MEFQFQDRQGISYWAGLVLCAAGSVPLLRCERPRGIRHTLGNAYLSRLGSQALETSPSKLQIKLDQQKNRVERLQQSKSKGATKQN